MWPDMGAWRRRKKNLAGGERTWSVDTGSPDGVVLGEMTGTVCGIGQCVYIT